jgi:hypothetical protein
VCGAPLKVRGMNDFSLTILERTLDLAAGAMPPEKNPEAAKCVLLIRGYIASSEPGDGRKLGQIVAELANIARQSKQFLIATRLEAFTKDLKAV